MPRVEASIRIENVVGTGTLNQRIDLNAVVKHACGRRGQRRTTVNGRQEQTIMVPKKWLRTV